MLKRFLFLGAMFVCVASSAMSQDACGDWLTPENPAASPRIAVSVSPFTNIPTGTTVERYISFGAQTALRLHSVLVTSTNCADCDVVVADTTCTIGGGSCTVANGGDSLVYYNNALTSVTVDSTTYSSFVYAIINADATPTSVSGDRRIYVRIKNNDGSSDDDVTVTLIWES